jgi:hypothetical protein
VSTTGDAIPHDGPPWAPACQASTPMSRRVQRGGGAPRSAAWVAPDVGVGRLVYEPVHERYGESRAAERAPPEFDFLNSPLAAAMFVFPDCETLHSTSNLPSVSRRSLASCAGPQYSSATIGPDVAEIVGFDEDPTPDRALTTSRRSPSSGVGRGRGYGLRAPSARVPDACPGGHNRDLTCASSWANTYDGSACKARYGGRFTRVSKRRQAIPAVQGPVSCDG